MKSTLLVAMLLLASTAAFAEEGQVSRATLVRLGLGAIQNVSDADGLAIRGKVTFTASVKGTSLTFGQLLTPDTKNFVVGSSVNEVDGDLTSTTGAELTKFHNVTIGTIEDIGDGFFQITPTQLVVNYPGFSYAGSMLVDVGGQGTVLFAP